MTFNTIYDTIHMGDNMNYTVIEFDGLPELAKKLKLVIHCYEKALPFPDSDTIFTWKELVSYLGKTFDIINNRQRALDKASGQDGFAKTINNVLRKSRVSTLKKALKEYNPILYEEL